MGTKSLPGALPQGKERVVIGRGSDVSGTATAAGSQSVEIGVDADTVIVSLFVSSVSGDLDITVDTVGGQGTVQVISFPTVSAPTANLLIRKAAAIMDRIRVNATYSDAVDFEVRVRGVGTGEASVRILGSNEAVAKQSDISTVDVLVGAALTDRSGLIVKNNNATGILFVGFTAAEATTGNGYPIGPGESLGMDIAAGQEVYGVASSGTIDVRILEAGG